MITTDKIKKLLKEYLDHLPDIAAAYLFGSYAEGKMSKDSDIDIAILLARGKKESSDKLKVMADLSRIFIKMLILLITHHHPFSIK